MNSPGNTGGRKKSTMQFPLGGFGGGGRRCFIILLDRRF